MKKNYIVVMASVILFVPLLVFASDRGLLTLLTKGSVDQVVQLINSWGMIAPLLSILLMIFQAIAAPIPAFLITAANGVVFGVYGGIIVSWVGAMLGALVSFFIAKWFGEKFVIKVKKEKKWMEKVKRLSGTYGFTTVLTARLIPVISFDVISFAAGLSGMRLRSFLTATGIGMIPGTVVYTILGHDLIHLKEYQNRFLILSLLMAFIVIIATIFKKKNSSKHRDEIYKE
ncbi:TVP38/TMEM64 family protein [Pseudalkalibacillus decolorationis]|uniref:TVP38/TMEM64 family protein n=1 Tax=Pseudalkalibacillus decolorationis TaxID=163879 RepID=UPI002148774E|nr:TVP38/TMEM64 family protein [Pseudalkalibacillus decolorationis]